MHLKINDKNIKLGIIKYKKKQISWNNRIRKACGRFYQVFYAFPARGVIRVADVSAERDERGIDM